MNIFQEIRELVITIIQNKLKVDLSTLESINVEIPKNPLHRDLSTNAAMVLAGHLNQHPKEIALILINSLIKEKIIKEAEIAGPGFINIKLNPEYLYQIVKEIILLKKEYGLSNIGNNEKVIVEYVSANPTGPMHVGHARGAIYGDALASLLREMGYNVIKEYYINDAGSQIEKLAQSLYARYRELYAYPYNSEENSYPGGYLIEIAQWIKDTYKDKFLTQSPSEWMPIFSKFGLEKNMEIIRSDLKDLGIEHDHFTSEKQLHDEGKIELALEKLKSKDMIYEGELEPPKGMEAANWQSRKQLLLKSTNYGDDQDRALTKSDGSWTYLAGDAAYTLYKSERGFSKQILVVGADHIGYQKRMLALTDSLSDGKGEFIFRACQLVNFIKGGQPFKMSKREGNFVTVADIIKLVGKDVIRFIMLTRKNDVPLDFDLDKVTEQSKDNPVFYVQYAHARVNSVFKMASEICPRAIEIFNQGNYDLSLLTAIEETDLIRKLATWPKVILGATIHQEPHRIAFYLEELAKEFHSLWSKAREDHRLKFIIEHNNHLTAARLALIKALQIVIANGLTIIGVSPIEQM